MKKSVIALALLAAAAPFAAAAQSAPGALNYNYVEGGYVYTKGDGNTKADGIGGNASFALTPNVHLFGGVNRQSVDVDASIGSDPKITHWRVGAGYNHAIAPTTDFVARGAFERYNTDIAPGFDSSINGYSAEVGVRSLMVPNLEGYAFVGYEDSRDFDGDFYGRLGANYSFTPNWSVTGDVKIADGAHQWFVGPRYSW